MDNIEQDLISVIIPAYNCEKYIDHCIKSVINQTYNKLQIIIVDDGSTDGTANKLVEYACIDKRPLCPPHHGGFSHSRRRRAC